MQSVRMSLHPNVLNVTGAPVHDQHPGRRRELGDPSSAGQMQKFISWEIISSISLHKTATESAWC